MEVAIHSGSESVTRGMPMPRSGWDGGTGMAEHFFSPAKGTFREIKTGLP